MVDHNLEAIANEDSDDRRHLNISSVKATKCHLRGVSDGNTLMGLPVLSKKLLSYNS